MKFIFCIITIYFSFVIFQLMDEKCFHMIICFIYFIICLFGIIPYLNFNSLTFKVYFIVFIDSIFTYLHYLAIIADLTDNTLQNFKLSR